VQERQLHRQPRCCKVDRGPQNPKTPLSKIEIQRRIGKYILPAL